MVLHSGMGEKVMGAMKMGVVRFFMHFDGSKTGVARILRLLVAIYLRGNNKSEHMLPHNY